ncbi:unnamed protein product [Linum trigynum]|uniref:Uncharacterized protein n=1 Tax=Linum trigynum TaxID=586398 RepID=A0AAV2G2J5_9ROSI
MTAASLFSTAYQSISSLRREGPPESPLGLWSRGRSPLPWPWGIHQDKPDDPRRLFHLGHQWPNDRLQENYKMALEFYPCTFQQCAATLPLTCRCFLRIQLQLATFLPASRIPRGRGPGHSSCFGTRTSSSVTSHSYSSGTPQGTQLCVYIQKMMKINIVSLSSFSRSCIRRMNN